MRVYQPAAQVASVEILDPNAPTADKKSGWAKRAEEVIASLPLIFLSHSHRLCFVLARKVLGALFMIKRGLFIRRTVMEPVQCVHSSFKRETVHVWECNILKCFP